MTARATLAIHMKTDSSGTRLRMVDPLGKELTVESQFSASQLPQLWGELNLALTEFKDKLQGRLEISKRDLLDSAEVLKDVGLLVASVMFGGDWRHMLDFCRASFKISNNLNVDLHVGLTETIPFEFLPLLDTGDFPASERELDLAGIDRLFRCFLGFSAPVRRISGVAPQDQVNALGAALPAKVCIFRHYGLDQTGEELSFCEDHSGSLSLEQTWPGQDLPADAEREFCSRFYDRSCLVDIYHFSCHYETHDRKPLESWLTLSDGARHPLEIRLGSMARHFARFEGAAEQRRIRDSGCPLVLFNACGASHIDASAAATLPGTVLNWKFCAFVGPQTKIPDVPASVFASYFYSALAKGATVGDSVLEARRNLLYNHLNPLGILYTLYGNSDLALPGAAGREEA